MRILVTGGAGFIGAHVTRHLLGQGHEVCVATRNTYAGKFRNLADVLPEISLLIGDLAERHFAEQCAAWTPEAVVHMAAETHVDRAIADPASFMRANVLGTTQLLQAVTQGDPVPKVLVYSTDEVYGPTPPGVAFDEHAPFKPSNAYSASKVGVEGLAQAFWVTHGLPLVVVRPCNTYGPGQHPEKVIPKFVRQLLQGETMTLYNDGQGRRDWLHVQDHARAVQVLLDQGQPGQAYNLAAESEQSDAEMARRVWHQVRYPAFETFDEAVQYVPGRPGHDRAYRLNGQKLRQLGWAPQVPLAQGISGTIRWNIEHQDWWASDVLLLRPKEVIYA